MTETEVRPLIGVTSYHETASFGSWRDVPSVVLPRSYVEHLHAAGADVVVLPPGGVSPRVLRRLDGIVLAGGPDVDPARYGAEPHPATRPATPEREATEFDAAAYAVEHKQPILGICRGMQVMAVAAGGSLVQHLPDKLGDLRHGPAPGVFGRHEVRIVPESRLYRVLGEHAEVPTSHHQAVADHPGFEATAFAEDGTVEALEKPDHPFCIAVQWHPEADTDPRLFLAFVAAAREYHRGRAGVTVSAGNDVP